MTWSTAALEDVAIITGGGTPSRAVPDYFGGNIRWATPTDVTRLDGLYISETKETITDEGLAESSAKLLPERSVLLTSRATIGYTAVTTCPMATNQGFINFVCGPKILPEYLARWLSTQKPILLQLAGGTTFKEVSKGNVKKLQIPVPPLSEQHRIVDILDRAASIQRLRKAADDKLKQIIPALFVDMFGDPVNNPRGWPSGQFSDVVSDIRNGMNPAKDQFGEGCKFITVNNLYDGLTIDMGDTSRVRLNGNDYAKYRLQRGDLCFVRSSVKRSGVGMASVFDCDEEAVFGGFVIRARLATNIVPLFACTMFHTPQLRSLIVESAGTATITNINQPALMALPVIIPPVHLQERFVNHIRRLESVSILADRAGHLAGRGAASLKQQLFS